VLRELCPFLSRVPAGFPSPADDDLESELDLNELLIQHPGRSCHLHFLRDGRRTLPGIT
jgi:DNA polymerase V